MKKSITCFILLFSFLAIHKISKAQETIPAQSKPIFSADSLAGGNYKDILTSFFQLAFNNLTGQNKEFNFKSNPFAVMLRNKPGLAVDKEYAKYTALRKLNFDFGIKLDSNYKFNGFSSGIKYSLINERDATTSKMLSMSYKNDSLSIETRKLSKGLRKFADKVFPNAHDSTSEDYKNKFNFINNANQLLDSAVAIKSLPEGFRDTVAKIAGDSGLNRIKSIMEFKIASSIREVKQAIFDSLKKSIEKNLLWTVGFSDTTNKDQFVFSNLVFSSELSKGIFAFKRGSNIELNIKAACNFLKDTLQGGRNLNRIVFNFEPGFNWVIRNKNNDKSILEFKVSGAYRHNFTRLYANEKRDELTANGTLRIRIYEDIWIPLEIKYDPKSGNILGFLNVKANFTGVGKLLKGII